MNKQIIPQDLWNEFEQEQEKIKDFDIGKFQLTPELNTALNTFFKKFLDPKEEFPKGERHSIIEKNFAIYIIKNNIPLDEIKKAYISNKFNISSLLAQIKGVISGSYGEDPNINIGELINWCKKFKPEFVNILKTEGNEDLKTFIFDKNEIIQNKVFTSHKLNNEIFGFGILLPRMEDIINKAKEVIGQNQVWRPVIITSNNRGLAVSKWLMNEYKIKFSETPYEMKLRWELKDIQNYLQGKANIINGLNLFNDIKKEYEHYCFYRGKEWYDVNSLWDLGTYFHQLCSAFPIKEERGLAGTGKTKGMVVSSYITLNATDIMTNPSEATIFRETDIMRPTKYIDEAEKLFKWTKYGVEPDNRVELINASYTRNGSVPRQEKIGNKFVTKWYHVYSPTRISSINGMYGATETRCITQIHTKAPDSDKRGEKDPEDDINNPKWKHIRNKCYLFALQNWERFQREYLSFDEKIKLKKRDLQIWKPLLVLTKIIDKDKLYFEVVEFAEKLSNQRKMDILTEGTLDYKFLKCLNDLIPYAISGKIYVNKIREQFNISFNEDETKKMGYNKTISTHIDKLGFKELRNKDMMGSYYEVTKIIFDEIISPLTSDFSSDTSYSSDNKGEELK